MSLEEAVQDIVAIGVSKSGEENQEDNNNDNTQSTLRTDETKPSETEQSKEEDNTSNLSEKAEEFNRRLENTTCQIDDLMVSVTTGTALSPVPSSQGGKNAPNASENEGDRSAKNESPKLIEYGDYFADMPESTKKENLMNNEPDENLEIDKESQELIDKLMAEDLEYQANLEEN